MTLRVLHILDHSLPLHSGYTFRTLAILREQRRLGWETFHLTSPKHTVGKADEEEIDGWHFFRTTLAGNPLARIPAVRELHAISRTTQRLEKVARRIRPDVLHAHSPVLNAIPALRVGRRLGIPVVYEVRAFWEDAAVDHGTSTEWGLRYRLTRFLETRALMSADHITTICDGLRREMISRGIPGERITVIPNAVDIEGFAFGSPRDEGLAEALGLRGQTVLGFIGSFYAYEGLALLLDALPGVLATEPDTRLLLVGGGPEETRLRERVGRMALTDKVVFTGRVPHSRVNSYYELIDVLVYPRLPMRLTDLVTPLKPLEAMAQGRIVVASNVGGHRELIRDWETGVLFRAGDRAALAAAIRQVLARRQRWPSLRQAARRFVEAERTWPLSVSRYRPVYAALTPAVT